MDARALRRMATEVDEQHREAMRGISESLYERHFATDDPARTASRRRFLGTVGLGGAAVVIGGLTVPVLGGVAGAQESEDYQPDRADLDLATFAWSLELTAVAAYRLAEESRAVIPAEGEVIRHFRHHHQDHADAFEALLGTVVPEEVGGTTSTTTLATPNAQLVEALAPQIEGATDAEGIAEVLLSIEEGAAATYLLALGELEDVVLAESAAKILPVESQHAVVWSQFLERPIGEAVPSFQTTADAFDPATYVA